jgi:hypothetical protein
VLEEEDNMVVRDENDLVIYDDIGNVVTVLRTAGPEPGPEPELKPTVYPGAQHYSEHIPPTRRGQPYISFSEESEVENILPLLKSST